jgi:predicted solute-binding protein
MFQSPFNPPVVGVPMWNVIAPLISGLNERGDIKLTTLPPKECADPLGEHGCACALVSPAALLDDPALRVLPGAGLVARETASSERLLCDASLESICRILVTPDALGLVRYVQVLFAERGLPQPTMVATGNAESADATLVSGVDSDPSDIAGYDIAALWRECTDTPFVRAVWVCRSDGPARLLRHVLGEAALRGVAALAEADVATRHYSYRMLSAESDTLRTLHRLARRHAIAGANVESIGFC